MPRLHGNLMIGCVNADGIDAEALLRRLFSRDNDRAVILQRLIGRDRRFDDPLFLQLLPTEIFRDGMDQRQAKVAARNLRYRAGGRLEDAQAIAMPVCFVGFIMQIGAVTSSRRV